MPNDFQDLDNLELMQEIQLRNWMYTKGFYSIQPESFSSNSTKLQNLIREKELQIKETMKSLQAAEKT